MKKPNWIGFLYICIIIIVIGLVYYFIQINQQLIFLERQNILLIEQNADLNHALDEANDLFNKQIQLNNNKNFIFSH